MIHELKCHPEPFDAVWRGEKFHEVRVNDRNYQVGDVLRLRRWDPRTAQFSGEIKRVVSYITNGGTYGLPDNLVVMSIHAGNYRLDVKSGK
jgi:hypothetical protein